MEVILPSVTGSEATATRSKKILNCLKSTRYQERIGRDAVQRDWTSLGSQEPNEIQQDQGLHFIEDHPIHAYRQEEEVTNSSPAEKEIAGSGGQKACMCLDLEGQPYPALH